MIYKYENAERFADIPYVDYKKYDGNIILFGAGLLGTIASALLSKREVEVICFADSEPQKWNTEHMGKPIISPQELKDRYPNAAIIITPYHMRPVYKQVREMGYETVFDCLHLFLEFDMEDVEPFLPDYYRHGQLTIFINNYMRKLYQFHVSAISRAVNVFVTERCTLRCKYCLNFTPYITSPKDSNWEMLSTSVDRLLRTGEFCFVNILGGETFLYGQLPELMEKLIASPNVEMIYPITNGTILPDERVVKSFCHKKVIVRISYYGEHSRKLNELKSLLEDNNVAYNVVLQEWYRFDVKQFERSEEENQKVFENCCKSNGTAYLIDGKLYRCGFAARLESLGVLPHSPKDCIDLMAEPYDEAQIFKKADEFYVMNEKFTQACRYCNGFSFLGERIPAAEQTVGELPPLPDFCK